MKVGWLTGIMCSNQRGDRSPHEAQNDAWPGSVVRAQAAHDTVDDVPNRLNDIVHDDEYQRIPPTARHLQYLLLDL